MCLYRCVGLNDGIMFQIRGSCPKLPLINLVPVLPEVLPCISLSQQCAQIMHLFGLPKPNCTRRGLETGEFMTSTCFERMPMQMPSHGVSNLITIFFVEECGLVFSLFFMWQNDSVPFRLFDPPFNNFYTHFVMSVQPVNAEKC